MAFSDPDPIEQDMGVRCEDMDPTQLVSYIKTFQTAYGRNLAVEGFMERSIFKSMKKIHGDKTAGQIVKWAFYKYKGVYQGDPITFTSFTKGRKWWVDKMSLEMQAHLRVETAPPVAEQDYSLGGRKLSSL